MECVYNVPQTAMTLFYTKGALQTLSPSLVPLSGDISDDYTHRHISPQNPT